VKASCGASSPTRERCAPRHSRLLVHEGTVYGRFRGGHSRCAPKMPPRIGNESVTPTSQHGVPANLLPGKCSACWSTSNSDKQDRTLRGHGRGRARTVPRARSSKGLFRESPLCLPGSTPDNEDRRSELRFSVRW
jgi:hypothetical protein